MLAKICSATVVGVDAVCVEVEVDIAPGLPAVTIVGLPDAAVQEAKERVRSAIKNSGFPFPTARLTVNLAPADQRKGGAGFDLPIALGILAAQGILDPSLLAKMMFAGELALDGTLRSIDGAINIALAAAAQGFASVVLPPANAQEGAAIEGVTTFTPSNLSEAVAHLSGRVVLEAVVPCEDEAQMPEHDLSEIKGQGAAKRALEIAVAGRHNLLLIGPPGSGKTMLARRAQGLCPPLSRAEAIVVTRIHSSAGRQPRGLIKVPPFRAPHHTVSDVGLIGGGSVPKPGEVSLAHHGMLFLDEFPEFGAKALEVLRQPLEDGMVTISRARGSMTYPAQIQLIAAMNPSPLGDWQTKDDPVQRRYLARLSGPLLDRIDLVVDVPKLLPDELAAAPSGDTSLDVRTRVVQARARMLERQGVLNAFLAGRMLREHVNLAHGPQGFMRAASARLNLSGRGYDRVLRVGRTIADLAGVEEVGEVHLAEAISFRMRDW